MTTEMYWNSRQRLLDRAPGTSRSTCQVAFGACRPEQLYPTPPFIESEADTMNPFTRLMNPITVIALFAGLSEASATTVLPYLDDASRQPYIWFLILFPSILVILFFLTLNFNPSALYTTPDCSNQPTTHDILDASRKATDNRNINCNAFEPASTPEQQRLSAPSKPVGSYD